MKLADIVYRRYMPGIAMLLHCAKFIHARQGRTMEVAAEVANDAVQSALADGTDSCDLSFLPKTLTAQCQSLIESYHELHGYSRLPDILWKARLGPFIETHRVLRQFLRKASTTRSAKKSHDGFVQIAKAILSLEILASSFAGWSAIYPEAGLKACAILRRPTRGAQMPLMEFYLYPPKYISTAAIATLAPPMSRLPGEADFYRTSRPELAGEKLALNYVNAIQQTSEARLSQPIPALP
jgi:hypothetical protein